MDGSRFNTDPSSQSYDASYERNQRHLDVDAYVNLHLISSHQEHHVTMEQIYHASLEAGLPDIACSPSQAKFLMLQIQMCNAKHILEIGTLGGYSAAWMASAGQDVTVTTIEIDQEYASLAQDNIAKAGLASRIEVLLGPALSILPTLVADVEAKRRPAFDFVFIDANKQDNVAYFEYALSATRPHAAIVVDNVVRNGKVAYASEAAKDDRVLGTRKLIETLGKDNRVHATVIQTVGEKNYDGFLLAVKQ